MYLLMATRVQMAFAIKIEKQKEWKLRNGKCLFCQKKNIYIYFTSSGQREVQENGLLN